MTPMVEPTAKPYTLTFIEAPLFTRRVREYLDDTDYAALQWALALHPEAGDVIPSSGGVRKLRWQGSGRGKRGGLGVVYYWRNHVGEIWLLTLYAKNEVENLSPEVLRRVKQEIEQS